MATPKQNVREILEHVPDDASYEDIHYQIYVRQKIEKGRQDIEQGRVLSEEEMEERMARWLGE